MPTPRAFSVASKSSVNRSGGIGHGSDCAGVLERGSIPSHAEQYHRHTACKRNRRPPLTALCGETERPGLQGTVFLTPMKHDRGRLHPYLAPFPITDLRDATREVPLTRLIATGRETRQRYLGRRRHHGNSETVSDHPPPSHTSTRPPDQPPAGS